MSQGLGAGPRSGVAAWLIANTGLTFVQIADYTRLPKLHVQAIADDTLSPRPMLIDPVKSGWTSRRDIEWAEDDESRPLPRSAVLCDSRLEPVSSRAVIDEAVQDVFVSRVAYLFYGRNAWHSTWIQRYYTSKSIGFTTSEVIAVAETNRVQGSVFNIEEIPCLVLRCASQTIYLVEINSGGWLTRGLDVFDGPAFTQRILAHYERVPPNHVIALVVPEAIAPVPAKLTRRFQRMTSYPRGNGQPLGWRTFPHTADVQTSVWENTCERVRRAIAMAKSAETAA
jgi:hypothetical protein